MQTISPRVELDQVVNTLASGDKEPEATSLPLVGVDVSTSQPSSYTVKDGFTSFNVINMILFVFVALSAYAVSAQDFGSAPVGAPSGMESGLVIRNKRNLNRVDCICNDQGRRYISDEIPPVFVQRFQQFISMSATTIPLGIGDNKAPGQITSTFFRKSWNVIGDEVCLAVKEFFYTGKLLREVNATKEWTQKTCYEAKGNLFKRVESLRMKLKDVQIAIDADP
ncbi:hypothetical protein Tco_0156475 [Tanacetum coccineum]